MHTYWVSFIKNGNPNYSGAVPWTPYDATYKQIMYLDETCSMKQYDFQSTIDELMQHYYPDK